MPSWIPNLHLPSSMSVELSSMPFIDLRKTPQVGLHVQPVYHILGLLWRKTPYFISWLWATNCEDQSSEWFHWSPSFLPSHSVAFNGCNSMASLWTIIVNHHCDHWLCPATLSNLNTATIVHLPLHLPLLILYACFNCLWFRLNMTIGHKGT